MASLASSTKQLSRTWDETRDVWRDAKAAQFEERFLLPLFDAVENAVAQTDKLEKMLTRVRSDCE